MSHHCGRPDESTRIWHAEDGVHIDVRGLDPPQPIVRLFELIDASEIGAAVIQCPGMIDILPCKKIESLPSIVGWLRSLPASPSNAALSTGANVDAATYPCLFSRLIQVNANIDGLGLLTWPLLKMASKGRSSHDDAKRNDEPPGRGGYFANALPGVSGGSSVDSDRRGRADFRLVSPSRDRLGLVERTPAL